LSAEERFRADLYYRLSVFTIHLPPLRDREEDVPILIRHFLRQYSRELGREIVDIAPDAMFLLQRYVWPGNIRELQSVMKQAILRSSGKVLLADFLPVLPGRAPKPNPRTLAGPAGTTGAAFDIEVYLRERLKPDATELYADLHREVDRQSLAQILTYTHGNQHMASRVLGIARQTLRAKLREVGLRVTQSIGSEIE
jgi:two-component system nitrogen regulation response regulator GlnG